MEQPRIINASRRAIETGTNCVFVTMRYQNTGLPYQRYAYADSPKGTVIKRSGRNALVKFSAKEILSYLQ